MILFMYYITVANQQASKTRGRTKKPGPFMDGGLFECGSNAGIEKKCQRDVNKTSNKRNYQTNVNKKRKASLALSCQLV